MHCAIRPPAVAGQFYPDSATLLGTEVDALLAAGAAGPVAAAMPRQPKALLVPHAGYVYSGPIAACAYAGLRPFAGTIRRVLLLGPAHRVAVRGIALPGATGFATPLGVVPVDVDAVDKLAGLPGVLESAPAHAAEHALEVQLPFLQRVLGDFALVPLVVGHVAPDVVAELIDRLWGGPETLIVISSDLSHYLPYASAQAIDQNTVQRLLALDAGLSHEEACGATPLNGFLIAARRHGLRPRLIDLCNSGDTAGDRARVVGYAALAFMEHDDAST